MIFKQGVRFTSLPNELVFALHQTDLVWLDLFGHEIFITSGNDSEHGEFSEHWFDRAFDIRTRQYNQLALPFYSRDRLLEARATVAERLGMAYDVVLEDDHIHIEYDPK